MIVINSEGWFGMASLIVEIRREATTLKWVMLTFLGAVINAVIWSHYLYFSQRLFLSLADLTAYSLFFALIIVVYSLFCSLSLPEKRIVAPSDIQLISFGIMLAVQYAASQGRIESYIVITIVSFLVLYSLGLMQDWIVTRAIGIYGTRKDCYLNSYTTEMPFDYVVRELRSKDFRESTGLSKSSKIRKTEIKVLHTPFGEGLQMFLFLRCPTDAQAQHCLINIVSYKRTKYGIMKSGSCEHLAHMTECLLRKLLKVKESDGDDSFTAQSLKYALKPTRNILKSKRVNVRIALTCLVAAFTILPVVMYRFGYLQNLESLVTIEIPAALAILIYFAERKKR
jgi:hypothetical protein